MLMIGLQMSETSQKAVVYCYLCSVLRHIDELDEERVMSLLQQHCLMSLVVHQLHKKGKDLPSQALEQGCRFLASAIDTETYMTRRYRYKTRNPKPTLLPHQSP